MWVEFAEVWIWMGRRNFVMKMMAVEGWILDSWVPPSKMDKVFVAEGLMG